MCHTWGRVERSGPKKLLISVQWSFQDIHRKKYSYSSVLQGHQKPLPPTYPSDMGTNPQVPPVHVFLHQTATHFRKTHQNLRGHKSRWLFTYYVSQMFDFEDFGEDDTVFPFLSVMSAACNAFSSPLLISPDIACTFHHYAHPGVGERCIQSSNAMF